MQTHFEALLKRRLRQEIEPRPPLFPWEKKLQDYPDTISNEAGAMSLWLDQLQNLDIPSTLPDDVLAELFQRCQQVAQQTRQVGVRLVNAVESIFPDQPQTLELIAGMVSRPAYRSSQAQVLDDIDYETASPQQQIALSMMAAQSIFEALALKVSPSQPTCRRQWASTAGSVAVEVTYRAQASQLEIKAYLPAAGALLLTATETAVESHRTEAGELVVHLDQPALGHPHLLELTLDAEAAAPLQLQVLVEAA